MNADIRMRTWKDSLTFGGREGRALKFTDYKVDYIYIYLSVSMYIYICAHITNVVLALAQPVGHDKRVCLAFNTAVSHDRHHNAVVRDNFAGVRPLRIFSPCRFFCALLNNTATSHYISHAHVVDVFAVHEQIATTPRGSMHGLSLIHI